MYEARSTQVQTKLEVSSQAERKELAHHYGPYDMEPVAANSKDLPGRIVEPSRLRPLPTSPDRAARSTASSQALERLVDIARALPGKRHPAQPVMIAAAQVKLDGTELDLRSLRVQLGRFLKELSQRLEPALTAALKRAAVAWETFDEVSVLDAALRSDAARIAAAARALEREEDPARRAAGLELRLTLESVLGLIDLVERRLATLVRLRVQSGEPSLLPGGRPFLDLAAALAEAARGWA